MSRPLLLVGAGGLARETAEAVRAGDEWHVVGFADDDPARWGTSVDGLPVLGGLDVAAGPDDWHVVLCPGAGAVRAALAQRLALLGVGEDRWATVVHPTASIGRSCAVAAGVVVLAGCVLTAGVTVRRSAVLMPGCVLTHDDVVDDFATLCARVALAGDVHVGATAYLGTGCVVREHLTVGDGAVIGMGAVVLQDVPPHEVWAGVPARLLGSAGSVAPPSRPDRTSLEEAHA